MQEHPIISVVVPIYNVEKYLRKCIDSLINQTFERIEIILVDDGSPDSCPEICDEYKLIYSNIKVIHKENGGLVSARRIGIQNAVGDYICFVDGDDWVQNQHFERIAQAIIENNCPDIVIFGLTRWNNRGSQRIVVNMEEGYYSKEDKEAYIIPVMISKKPFFEFGISPSACAKAFKRELILSNDYEIPKSITMGEDAALSYPMIEKAQSIYILHAYDYMYRTNPESMSYVCNEKTLEGIVLLATFMKCWAKNSYYYMQVYSQVQEYVCYIYITTFENMIKYSDDIDLGLTNLKKLADIHVISDSLSYGMKYNRLKMTYDFVSKHRCLLSILLKLYWRIKNKIVNLSMQRT